MGDGRGEQRAKTRQVLDVLQAHGDALTSVRGIDHWAYFRTAEDRSRFVDACAAAGFQLGTTSESDLSRLKYGARIFHADIPTESVLDDATTQICELALASGGEYDGWETQLIE
jgi:regulator of RNase E activity RraB